MPEFWAVRCYNCQAFVAQQKKKVKKWKCPICGSKQSVKRIYGTSNSGKDIRQLIVQLNQNRAEYDRKEQETKQQMNEYLKNNNINEIIEKEIQTQTPIKNKWNEYEKENNNNKNQSNNTKDENDMYVLQIPQEYKKKKGRGKKWKNNTTNKYNNSQKRSRYEYEESNINNKQYNFNNCEPLTKKIKTKKCLVNKKENNKENDEWNWNIWDENDSNVLNVKDNNNDTNKNDLISESYDDSNGKMNELNKNVSFDKKNSKNVLESESDDEEFIEKSNNSNVVIGVDIDNGKSNGNIEIILESQNNMNKSNVYKTEKYASGTKWSEYL